MESVSKSRGVWLVARLCGTVPWNFAFECLKESLIIDKLPTEGSTTYLEFVQSRPALGDLLGERYPRLTP